MELRKAEIERADRAQRRCARRAQHRRLGQRVAEIALERRARQPQHCAHCKTQQCTRNAQIEQDRVGDGVAMTGQRRHDAG